MQYDMTDFAENACKAYEELSGCTLKKAATPYLPEGSLVDSDFEDRGQMAENASHEDFMECKVSKTRFNERNFRSDSSNYYLVKSR